MQQEIPRKIPSIYPQTKLSLLIAKISKISGIIAVISIIATIILTAIKAFNFYDTTKLLSWSYYLVFISVAGVFLGIIVIVGIEAPQYIMGQKQIPKQGKEEIDWSKVQKAEGKFTNETNKQNGESK